jgi:uncharacterized protein (DUF736 family)
MNTNNTTTKQKDIGALWIKESKAGNKFVSISVTIDGTVHNLVAFKNNYKTEGSNQPDYRIFPSEQQTKQSNQDSF